MTEHRDLYVEPSNVSLVLSYLRDMYEINHDVLSKSREELGMTEHEYKSAWEDLMTIEAVLKDNAAL